LWPSEAIVENTLQYNVGSVDDELSPCCSSFAAVEEAIKVYGGNPDRYAPIYTVGLPVQFVEEDEELEKLEGKRVANCEICGYRFNSEKDCFVHGETKKGAWAIMCVECHYTHGVSLGYGHGKKYQLATLTKVFG
jgi:hypothetical protein